jgi:hypothetical protein
MLLFLMAFGGTILGKLVEDYRAYKKQTIRRSY